MTEGEYRARWAALGAQPLLAHDKNVKWNVRRWAIYDSRCAGKTFSEIAAEHGISAGRARAVYAYAALALDHLETREEARRMRR